MKRIAFLLVLVLSGCPTDPPVAPDDWDVVVENLDGSILSFWGNSTSEIFAVGGPVSRPGQAFILRYDGTRWEHMPLDAPTLWWVQGFASDDVWAVGEQGTIVHFDGSEWSVVVSDGADYTLWGVWGASPDDIWTVGGTVEPAGVPSIIRHYDGSTWEDVPDIGLESELLFKVWGVAEDDVWVVGTGGATLHYDGDAWTRLPPVTEERILTVRGRATDDIYAVGGVIRPVVLHYDGSAWTEVPVDVEGGLMGIWTATGQPTVMSGRNGVVLVEDGDRFHRVETNTLMDLHAAWGDGTGSFLAGGGLLFPSPTPAGVITGLGEVQGGEITTWTP